ncbi:MAG: response regulator [Pseudomonadota bacterium]
MLIADDSSTMRKIIKNILTGIGVQKILEAQDGVEALRKVEECHIDVILTDWNMPRMNGLEFIKNIRSKKELDNTKIIVITAEGSGKVEPALEAGANGFLYKPFNTNKLREVLEGITSK